MLSQSTEYNVYENNMDALRRLCRYYHELMNSEVYCKGKSVRRYQKLFEEKGMVRGTASAISMKMRNKRDNKTLRKSVEKFERTPMELSPPDYFSDERIAVYTCIFGAYDRLIEPVCYPDNIDYYIITDQDVPLGSIWKKVDLSPFAGILEGKTPVEKNRWFKMHPAMVFTNYRYSIYIDGNVVPVTDFTEFVNRIGDCGIAMFWHSFNNCVYQEAMYNRYLVKKVSNEEIQAHMTYLKEQGMPENYGMTTCNVIARDHTNQICMKLMDDWWTEFMAHCKRDQLSFPYVAWKNNINMADIAVLGDDVWNTDALLVVQHTD